MFIIIEGADKTGKTTLANAIVKKFGCKYVHFGKPKKRAATEYAEYLLSTNENQVCDRFHLGELVYGPIFRGGAAIDDVEFATIERLLRLKQAILIQTTTDVTLANSRLAVSTQDEAVDSKQNQVAIRGFKQVIKRSNLQHIIKYDGSNYDNLNQLLSKLVVLKYSVERDQALIQNFCTGIGTPSGKKIVLVGESVNKNITWLNLPFDKGFSSQFLLDSLKAANVPEHLVYVCNADKLTSHELELLTHDKTLFITLGNKANTRLNHFDIPHSALPHPQYVKRFQWKNKDQYVKDIAAIVKGF
jgi:hypothetical protein